MSPGLTTPPVATRRARSKPAGGCRRRGWTASIVPSAPTYTAPSRTTGCSSSYVTTVPVTTIGSTVIDARSREDLAALVRRPALELRLLVVGGLLQGRHELAVELAPGHPVVGGGD